MTKTTRSERREEILAAARALLAERGYQGTSMLDVARRASASKETLYSWFGDKRGLFEAVIRHNARSVQAVLADHLETDADIRTALEEFGRALLALLTGDSAVAINRAAISEALSEPSLAQTLASAGREATMPAFVALLERHRRRGALAFDDPSRASGDFLGLLIGELQVRRLLGLAPVPDEAAIAARAARAADAFLRLYGTGQA